MSDYPLPPGMTPEMLAAMQGFVPQTDLEGDPLSINQQMSVLNSGYGNLMFDMPFIGLAGPGAFSPQAFTPMVTQEPVDSPMFSAFSQYLNDDTTFEGMIAREIIEGGSARTAVQKIRALVEANPDDPNTMQLIQMLTPVPYDAMADPNAPLSSQIDWGQAQDDATRIFEQYHSMPAGERSLLPQVLGIEPPGGVIDTEDGQLSLGQDGLGNPIIMRTTETMSEPAQKFAELGMSNPADVYEATDFLPASWQVDQQNYQDVVLPAVEQAMAKFMSYPSADEQQTQDLMNQLRTPGQNLMENPRLTPSAGTAAAPAAPAGTGELPAQASELTGAYSRGLQDVQQGVTTGVEGALAKAFGQGWQQALERLVGGVGASDAARVAQTTSADPGGLGAVQAAQAMLERLFGTTSTTDGGGGGLSLNPLDLFGTSDTGSGGSITPSPAGNMVPLGPLMANRAAQNRAQGTPPEPPIPGQTDPDSEAMQRLLGATPAGNDGGYFSQWQQALNPEPPPQPPSGGAPAVGQVEPGAEVWNRVLGDVPSDQTDALLRYLLTTGTSQYSGHVDQSEAALARGDVPGPPPVTINGQPNPAYQEYLDQTAGPQITGVGGPPDPLSTLRAPTAPDPLSVIRALRPEQLPSRGNGTARDNLQRSTYREPPGRRSARSAWFDAIDQANTSRQQVYGGLGSALGQAAVMRAQGVTPYMNEMMARRQAAMLMGMPSGI